MSRRTEQIPSDRERIAKNPLLRKIGSFILAATSVAALSGASTAAHDERHASAGGASSIHQIPGEGGVEFPFEDTGTDKVTADTVAPTYKDYPVNIISETDASTYPQVFYPLEGTSAGEIFDAENPAFNKMPADEMIQFILDNFRNASKGNLFIDSTDNKSDIASLWTFSQVLEALKLAYDVGLITEDELITAENLLPHYYSDSRDVPSIIFNLRDYPAGYNSEIAEEIKDINVRYVDDNLWIAEYFMKRYQQTGDEAYLDGATGIAELFIQSWNDSGGNGSFWQAHVHDGVPFNKESNDRAVVSNAPAIPILIELSKLKPEKAHYADIAKDVYDWLQQNLRDPKTGMYFDKIQGNGEIDKTFYPYCQAKVIDAVIALNSIEPDAYSLNDAKQLFDTSAQRFLRDGRLGHNPEFDRMLVEAGYRLADKVRDPIFTEFARYFAEKASLAARSRAARTNLVNIAGTANLALLKKMHPDDWHELWYTTKPSW